MSQMDIIHIICKTLVLHSIIMLLNFMASFVFKFVHDGCTGMLDGCQLSRSECDCMIGFWDCYGAVSAGILLRP